MYYVLSFEPFNTVLKGPMGRLFDSLMAVGQRMIKGVKSSITTALKVALAA